jgi:hypothetical protein
MPRQGSRVKEARGTTTRGATTIIFIAGIDEATHNSEKDEEIAGAAHNTTVDHYPPG